MKNLMLATMLSLATAASTGAPAATAASAALPEADARAMTTRGEVIVSAMGKEEMMMRIHAGDPSFKKGKLAVTMRDLYTGVVLAHPLGPAYTGTDNAKAHPANPLHARQVIEMAQSSGKGRVGQAWVLRVDDVVLEAGIEQP